MSRLDNFLKSLSQFFHLPKKTSRKKKVTPKKKTKKTTAKKIKRAVKKKSAAKSKSTKTKKSVAKKKKTATVKKKKSVKKVAKKTKVSSKPKKKTSLKKVKTPEFEGEHVGEVTHFFPKIQVIVLKMEKAKLKLGDTIHLKGPQTDFKQRIDSLQIESRDVKSAKKGQLVGLKVKKKAKIGDKCFKTINL